MDTTKLTLRNMIFYGYHGVYSAEKEMGQRIEVDLELVSDFGKAAQNDDLEATINYTDVYTIVKNVVEEGEYNLIEGIAAGILDQIFAVYDLKQATVRVRKPQPPIGGLLDTVEFEITKEQK